MLQEIEWTYGGSKSNKWKSCIINVLFIRDGERGNDQSS